MSARFAKVSQGSVFPAGSLGELQLLAFTAFLVLVFSGPSKYDADYWEKRLVAEFREIVREPLPDPDDPRFKTWDPRERFPWGWAVVQGQLHERMARRQAGHPG